jgi:hypothetical protein
MGLLVRYASTCSSGGVGALLVRVAHDAGSGSVAIVELGTFRWYGLGG